MEPQYPSGRQVSRQLLLRASPTDEHQSRSAHTPPTGSGAESPPERRTGGRPPRLLPTMDPALWLTRGDAARRLGVHVSTIRRLEARGELVPNIEEEGGLRYFTLWQVMELRNRRARGTRDRAAEIRLAAFEPFVAVRIGATSRSTSATTLCGSTTCGGSIPSVSSYLTRRAPSPGNRGHRSHRSQSSTTTRQLGTNRTRWVAPVS
jgi:MerR family regulatory protein